VDYYQDTIVTAVDGKGRLSIPPAYRRVLKARCGHEDDVIIGRDPAEPCLTGFDVKRFHEKNAELEGLYAGFDEAREAERVARARRLSATVRSFNIETPGRIILPKPWLDKIGISTTAVFVAAGSTFQIWSPENALKIADEFLDVAGALDIYATQKAVRS
jgi:MraZ protein